jgi:hypothetical protein
MRLATSSHVFMEELVALYIDPVNGDLDCDSSATDDYDI